VKKDAEQQIQRAKQELEEVEKNHSKCKNTISKLTDKVEGLTQEL
jgi:DNA repair ATPase RecN